MTKTTTFRCNYAGCSEEVGYENVASPEHELWKANWTWHTLPSWDRRNLTDHDVILHRCPEHPLLKGEDIYGPSGLNELTRGRAWRFLEHFNNRVRAAFKN